MSNNKTAVIAIGGNFLSDGRSTTEEQMARAYKAAEIIKVMVLKGFKVVVVHGNGPQVGMAYLRQLEGQKVGIPTLNLALCNALTQGEIGTMLELAIVNTINREKTGFDVLTLVSQVEVRKDDPAFQRPTKPIGPFMTKEESEEMKRLFPDWTIIEDSGRGYRRVVPSPVPVKVYSSHSIADTFKTADVIISGGGGGIPVFRNEDTNTFELIDSVIDKDRTAYLIAREIGASHFLLLTNVPQVCVNFGKPDQKALYDVTVDEIKKYYAEGQFPPGSMGPKIEAALAYAEGGGTAIITDADHIGDALDEKAGTRIHK